MEPDTHPPANISFIDNPQALLCALHQHLIVSFINIDGMIIQANQNFCQISGYQESELQGKKIGHVLFNGQPIEFFNKLFNEIKCGRTWQGEITATTRSGKNLWLNTTVAPCVYNPEHAPTIFVIMQNDITRQKAYEKELKHAKAAAEQANQAKSDFLTSMSHELRTPLNAIIGFSELLELNTRDPLTATQKEYTTYIQKGGKHILKLINDVIDLAKIETGRIDINIKPVPIVEILNECIEMLKTMASKMHIHINMPTILEHILPVMADYTRIKQIILILLSNAIKYNTPNGSVTISIEQNNEISRINIKDTGRGIPEQKLQELFKPFNRLGAEGSRIEGTGIGLVVSRKLIKLMSGHIEVVSQVDRGSTFCIKLPTAHSNHEPSKI